MRSPLDRRASHLGVCLVATSGDGGSTTTNLHAQRSRLQSRLHPVLRRCPPSWRSTLLLTPAIEQGTYHDARARRRWRRCGACRGWRVPAQRPAWTSRVKSPRTQTPMRRHDLAAWSACTVPHATARRAYARAPIRRRRSPQTRERRALRTRRRRSRAPQHGTRR
jgi:hypothetical protein